MGETKIADHLMVPEKQEAVASKHVCFNETK